MVTAGKEGHKINPLNAKGFCKTESLELGSEDGKRWKKMRSIPTFEELETK